jgi:hypothetical protein
VWRFDALMGLVVLGRDPPFGELECPRLPLGIPTTLFALRPCPFERQSSSQFCSRPPLRWCVLFSWFRGLIVKTATPLTSTA